MTANELSKILQEGLSPTHITVEDQSVFHRHHKQNTGGSHFGVTIVSEQFEGLSTLEAHRKIYGLVGMPGNAEIHALSIEHFTPQIWSDREKEILSE